MGTIPPDFDWVTERHKCSAVKVFQRLSLLAERDVSTMNTVAQERGIQGPFEFASGGGDFSVCRLTHAGISGVRFKLHHDERISVEGEGVKVGFVARLTLNDDGECRLQVGDQQLDLWQALRRALEPLFFNLGRD